MNWRTTKSFSDSSVNKVQYIVANCIISNDSVTLIRKKIAKPIIIIKYFENNTNRGAVLTLVLGVEKPFLRVTQSRSSVIDSIIWPIKRDQKWWLLGHWWKIVPWDDKKVPNSSLTAKSSTAINKKNNIEIIFATLTRIGTGRW